MKKVKFAAYCYRTKHPNRASFNQVKKVNDGINYVAGDKNVRIRVTWPCRPALISFFCSIKRPGVFLLPPGWNASPSQGYPEHQVRQYSFLHLGGETWYPVIQFLNTQATELANYLRHDELNTFPCEDMAGSLWYARNVLPGYTVTKTINEN